MKTLFLAVSALATAFPVAAAFAQAAPASQPQIRYVTDPAEIEALLAACGLSGKPAARKAAPADAPSAKAPPAPAPSAEAAQGGPEVKKKIRCSLGGH